MAAIVPDTAVGITLEFTSGHAAGFTIEAFSFDGTIEQTVIDKTHFGSDTPDASTKFGGRERMVGELSSATMSFEGHFDSNAEVPVSFDGASNNASTQLVITWPDTTTWTGNWVVSSYQCSGSVEPEDHMNVTIELMSDGIITVAPSA